jgi:hypothetical protein
MSIRDPALKKILVILGLFVLTLLYFHDVLTGKVLLVERDLATFFYPYRFLWVETVRQGHFPFWNPYLKCGVPLFATIQPGVLYPLSFLAGAFTYSLMRELGASPQGALAAALAFLFSGYLISVHNVLNTLLSVSWYPLVMLCGCRMVRTGLLRWAAASGVSLCCMFLGGGMEIVLLTFASLLLLCLYPRVLPLKDAENGPTLQRRLISLGLTLVIFLGLAMVQILPFLELYKQSHRYGGVHLGEATLWSLAPRDLIYFLLPSLYGPTATPSSFVPGWILLCPTGQARPGLARGHGAGSGLRPRGTYTALSSFSSIFSSVFNLALSGKVSFPFCFLSLPCGWSGLGCFAQPLFQESPSSLLGSGTVDSCGSGGGSAFLVCPSSPGADQGISAAMGFDFLKTR